MKWLVYLDGRLLWANVSSAAVPGPFGAGPFSGGARNADPALRRGSAERVYRRVWTHAATAGQLTARQGIRRADNPRLFHDRLQLNPRLRAYSYRGTRMTEAWAAG